MTSESLRRRKFLSYLGLGTVGLSATITAQKLGNSLNHMNPSIVNSGLDHTKRFASPMPESTFQLPEFTGVSAWLNSLPIAIANLQGKVVLVQFCTFACINWQRTLPDVLRWHQEYADRGLQIIGVHSPEFDFERDVTNVKRALLERRINYPVAIDNNYQMWRAYNNEYWPHLFLADRQGIIQYDHIGEGAYAETEQKIRELLS